MRNELPYIQHRRKQLISIVTGIRAIVLILSYSRAILQNNSNIIMFLDLFHIVLIYSCLSLHVNFSLIMWQNKYTIRRS